jgi:PAS domain S-box-containing protein
MSTHRPGVEFYESLIDTSPIVVFRLAGDGSAVRHISGNCERLFGWDPAAVVDASWDWREHVHPDDLDRMTSVFTTVVEEHDSSGTATFRLRRADGALRWTMARIRPDPSQPGELLGFFVDVQDRVEAAEASERMVGELRESQLFLTSVIENIPNMVFVKDAAELRFVRFNRAGEQLIGRQREDLIGKDDHDLFPAVQADAFVRADREVLEEGVLLDVPEEEIDTATNGRRILHTRKIPILDDEGRARYLLGISDDITERRLADDALRVAKEEAERANQAKNDFLSRMSHELRTPLNSVLGFAQLLELDELEPQQDEAVHQILKAGRHLVDLIDEVLDISRIEAGTMALSLEPVALDTMIAECLDLVRPQARARSIELRNEDGRHHHVHADRQRLRQVLLNLLSNAVKFNRDGGSITVSCEHREHAVEVHVADTGPGIRPELVERLFTPFDRLEADEIGVQGTGLGLALSRRLLEAMHGTIGVRSTVGEGTTVSFVLLVGAGEVAADEQRVRQVASLVRPAATTVVLHVEDNLANLRLVEEVFVRRPEVRLVTAQQGSLGLELAAEHRPDLILLDLHLPDLDGDEVLQRLKASDATAGIPVVVVSADATERQVQRLRALGAHDYLTKPLDVAHLLDVVDGLLAVAAAEGGGSGP